MESSVQSDAADSEAVVGVGVRLTAYVSYSETEKK
jgi:hypothetical protein